MKKKRRRSTEKPHLQRKTQADKSSEAEITVEIGLPSKRVVETVYAAVLPETLQTAGFRSETTVRKRGKVLVLTIKARDIVALRAASNSFLRFVAVASKAVDVVAPFYRAGRSELNSRQSVEHFE